eukprot:m.121902 g.121902  ORF g.121902 m.121902 type:complete len:305 (+) comp28888_c1_seq3:858-1772(+)
MFTDITAPTTDVALRMKIRHLESELRKKSTEIKDLKVALKDSLYENASVARSLVEVTTNAKVQVQKHIKHVKAVTDLHTQLHNHHNAAIEHYRIQKTSNEAHEASIESLQKGDIKPDVEEMLKKKDSKIELLQLQLKAAISQSVKSAKIASTMAKAATQSARSSLVNFRDYKENTHALIDARSNRDGQQTQIKKLKASLDSCRNDVVTAMSRLGVKTQYVEVHHVDGDVGVELEEDKSFGYGGAKIVGVVPASAACSTGGIRIGDYVIGVDDRVMWGASFDGVTRALKSVTSGSHLLIGWKNSS